MYKVTIVIFFRISFQRKQRYPHKHEPVLGCDRPSSDRMSNRMMFMRVIHDVIPIRWPIYLSHFVNLEIFCQTLSSKYMRKSSYEPSSEPPCGSLPQLPQSSVTQHSSVSIVQLSFGQATSRPNAHAAPEGPQPSFWRYVGHWRASGRCLSPMPFVSFVPLHGGQIKHDPYLKPVNLGKTDHIQ